MSLELFAAPNVAHLATVLPDGGPHSVPLWVLVKDGRIAFFSFDRALKVRNIERDARVALSIAQLDLPTNMATARGRVIETLRGEAALPLVDEISRAYEGKPYDAREGLAAFVVEVDRSWAADYSGD